MKRILGILCLSLLLSAAAPPGGGRMPVLKQVGILLKSLTHDRNLKIRCTQWVHIGVVSFRKNSRARDEMKELIATLRANKDVRLSGLRVVADAIEIDNVEELFVTVDQGGFNLLYLCSGLSDEQMKQISSFADFKNLLLMGGSREYIGKGVALSVIEEQHTPRIVVDRARAHEQGADFSPQLLKLSVRIE